MCVPVPTFLGAWPPCLALKSRCAAAKPSHPLCFPLRAGWQRPLVSKLLTELHACTTQKILGIAPDEHGALQVYGQGAAKHAAGETDGVFRFALDQLTSKTVAKAAGSAAGRAGRRVWLRGWTPKNEVTTVEGLKGLLGEAAAVKKEAEAKAQGRAADARSTATEALREAAEAERTPAKAHSMARAKAEAAAANQRAADVAANEAAQASKAQASAEAQRQEAHTAHTTPGKPAETMDLTSPGDMTSPASVSSSAPSDDHPIDEPAQGTPIDLRSLPADATTASLLSPSGREASPRLRAALIALPSVLSTLVREDVCTLGDAVLLVESAHCEDQVRLCCLSLSFSRTPTHVAALAAACASFITPRLPPSPQPPPQQSHLSLSLCPALPLDFTYYHLCACGSSRTFASASVTA